MFTRFTYRSPSNSHSLKISILTVGIIFCLNASAQKIHWPKNLSASDSSISRYAPALALQVLSLYKEPNLEEFFDNVFRYQLAAQQYRNTIVSLDSGDKVWGDTGNRAGITGLQFRSYAIAKEAQARTGKKFEIVYGDTLSALYNRLPEEYKEYSSSFFQGDTAKSKASLEALIQKYSAVDSISLDEARAFLKLYTSWTVDKSILPVARPFLRSERNKKYSIEDNVLIQMPDGAKLSATIVRRLKDPTPLPVILMYNIYSDNVGEEFQASRATEAANKGYVSIILNTRGKKGSPQAIEPFEHDGNDVYYAIDWISKQSWCNGKIGMYGGSYLGFSQWSATKKLHQALKTIVPQVAVGIGIDYPLHNGIFMGYMLRWIHYVTNSKGTDQAEFRNQPRWDSLYLKWYKSGRSFRALDTLDGRANNIFQRWLDHPGYDQYWQAMVPYGKEFASINIPVLTTTGYFDDDQRGAFYYMHEHLKWNTAAKHYLIIGPWNHGGGQGYTAPRIGNYALDSVGNFSVNDVVFKWFDHFLKDSTFPSFLKDKVNFQVAGANEWRSASSLKAASNDSMLLYLSNVKASDGYKLTTKKSLVKASIAQEISYTDRDRLVVDPEGSDVSPMDTVIAAGESLIFASEPLTKSTIVNGSFEGMIKVLMNKKDVDLNIRLYERTADGKYFLLGWFLGRASYLRDRSKRQLLTPGIEQTIPIVNTYWGCRKMAAGSRIVAVVGMNKSPGWQMNYGTGKDVSDETIADGKQPLQIEWMNSSYIKLPLLK